MAKLLLIGIIISYVGTSAAFGNIFEEDFCSGEHFKPKCQRGEMVLMESAFYGQMEVGRCIPNDLGYVGCKSNVLEYLDETCSGKSNCDVLVTEVSIPDEGGCMKGLSRYLQVKYTCKPEKDLSSICGQQHGERVLDVSDTDIYISSIRIQECIPNERSFIIKAREGHIFNVSITSLGGTANKDSVFGSVIDTNSEKRVSFSGNLRNKHLLSSTSEEIEINIQKTALFILNIEVSGCPNMEPPTGAWMTRNGNLMEIGCHSGSKSWTLECQNIKWAGSVGQCGQIPSTNPRKINPDIQAQKAELTIDAVVFGISSLVILCSAVIFLCGVCILKRKLKQKNDSDGLLVNRINPAQQQLSANTLSTNPPAYDMYMNTKNSSASESVKFFVLEDGNKS